MTPPFSERDARRLGPVRNWLWRHPVAMDVIVAIWFGIPSGLTAILEVKQPWLVPLVVAGMVALMARRRAPLLVLAAVTVLGIAAAVRFGGLSGFDFAVAFAVYAVAVARPPRVAWTSLAVSTATLGAAVALRVDVGRRVAELTGLGLAVLLGIAIGISVRNRRVHVTELVERGNALSRDAEQRSQLATAAERARIAREMHDVVAHSLSVMIALADGASASIQKSPVAAQAALDRLSETGRAALADMRRVLGVLRDGDASFEPAPGGPDLHTLVQSYRDAGMPVQLTVSGTALPTDTGLQLAMYRIVQESLTNALRHTSGSGPVTVVVAHTPGNVDIRVTSPEDPAQDSPKPPASSAPASSAPGGGRGIIGMRERAAIYGGTVDAGPCSLGWRVHATLHWDEESA